MSLTHASLFSGVGGIDKAAEDVGFTNRWACEVDPVRRAVLNHHWPTLPIFADVAEIADYFDQLPRAEVVSAGSPCQGLSIAGKQAGLQDERSGLFIRFAQCIDEMRPRFGVWENVPGALTSPGFVKDDEGGKESRHGEDFAAVMALLLGLEIGDVPRLPKAKGGRRSRRAGYAKVAGGRSLAWRVLNARFLGVPQNRERIVLVVDTEGTRAPAEILFPDLDLDVPRPPEVTFDGGFAILLDEEVDTGEGLGIEGPALVDLLEGDVDERWYLSPKAAAGVLSRTRRRMARNSRRTHNLPIILETALMMTAGEPIDEVTAKLCQAELEMRGHTVDREFNNAVVSKWYRGTSGPSGDEHHNLVATFSITPESGKQAIDRGRETEASNALTATSESAKNGRGTHIVTFRKSRRAQSSSDHETWTEDPHTNTLNGFDSSEVRAVDLAVDIDLPLLRVRRLTHLEAERLQGFDDHWTDIGDDTTATKRFQQIGDAVAVPVFRWVFERIEQVAGAAIRGASEPHLHAVPATHTA